MATKYYAVKVGRNPGIYTDVDEYRAQVDGFTGYKAQAFKSEELAKVWLNDKEAKRYYAVRVGRTPGIYTDVVEYKKQVDGFTLAVSKKFKSFDEAYKWVSKKPKAKKANPVQPVDPSKIAMEEKRKQALTIDTSGMIAFVDGSFNHETNRYAYGVVILHNDEEKLLYGSDDKEHMIDMCNVAGEISGAMAAMQYAIDNGINEITIMHDFKGISTLCTNDCKAHSQGTVAYKNFYDTVVQSLDVRFKKVDGHSGNYYNELADALARKAAGVRIKKPVAKRLAVVGEV